jgi:hypothetical protein
METLWRSISIFSVSQSNSKGMVQIIPFEKVSKSDIIIDAVYEGGSVGNVSSDPISKLLPGIGNRGGFRFSGKGKTKKLIVLYSSGEDKDWPDHLDLNTGQFVYYGDNKTPGHELHNTKPGGNRMLRNIFDLLHIQERSKIPPVFIFKKYMTINSSRSVQFKGLAVPGFQSLSATEDLVAVWKSTEGQRFQNYRSVFTILNIGVIERAWLVDIFKGHTFSSNTPAVWKKWTEGGKYNALGAEPTRIIRTIEQQTPQNELGRLILSTVWNHFKDTPILFEPFAAKLFQMYDSRVLIDLITRGTIDGGRDALGRYLIGLNDDPVFAEFTIEAKCYRPFTDDHSANTVGVKEVSRLISRIRNRQFGVLVTTSVVARQAYEEVRTDQHPIIFISGKDIGDILIMKGYNTPELVKSYLEAEFPSG